MEVQQILYQLSFAQRQADYSLFQYTLQQYDKIDAEGNTLLHLVISKNYTHLVSDIVQYNKILVHQKNKNLQTPLHIACLQGKAETVKFLLASSLKELQEKDKKGLLPIHYAVKGGDYHVIEVLVQYGADISAMDSRGLTVLHHCVLESNLDLFFKLLKQYKLNINIKSGYTAITPLHAAAMVGNLEMVHQLTEFGADINSVDINQNTALHQSVLKNDLPMVELLVNCGADLDLKNKNQQTPLQLAQTYKFDKIVEHIQKFQENKNLSTVLKKSKKCKVIRNLVFQGGGMKGLSYVGALEALLELHEKNIILLDLQRVGGSSAGAIFALLIALGIS